MALARTVVSEGLIDELNRFEALVRPLSSKQWDTPSRCDGWTVGDVARHVIGSMADVAAGRLDGPRLARGDQARGRRAGRALPAELADECAEVTKAAAGMLPLFDDAAWAAPGPGGFDGTLGDGVEALWYDTWLHANDIRAALGPEAGHRLGPAPRCRTSDGISGATTGTARSRRRRRRVRVHSRRNRTRRRFVTRRRRTTATSTPERVARSRTDLRGTASVCTVDRQLGRDLVTRRIRQLIAATAGSSLVILGLGSVGMPSASALPATRFVATTGSDTANTCLVSRARRA